MLYTNKYKTGFSIDDIQICDFASFDKISNEEILERSRGSQNKKLLTFLDKKIGIESRYWVKKDQNSYHIAKQALKKLIDKNPKVLEEADFFIFAGISNPMPTVCMSALLSCEFEFKNTSCWDLKSGCSTGVLAIQQALSSFHLGAKKGIIVCSETFSKFSNPETLQMSAAIGDGACALIISSDNKTDILGSVHGTDARYFKTMYVPGEYPVDLENYNPHNYFFQFSDKADTIETIGHYWKQSLEDVLKVSNLKGEDIDHYISHQVDGTKNLAIGLSHNIKKDSIALNFKDYGNMGCPTIFINLYFWLQNKNFNSGETMILHAVGGGLSWAAICLRRK